MASAKLTYVYVSREVAVDLIDTGVASSIFESNIRFIPNDDAMWAYQWHLTTGHIAVLYSTRVTPEDDIARILMLMPTIESRLYYLNNH